MMKRILVPLDGSYRSEQALRIVDRLAQSQDIELVLLNVVDVTSVSYPGIGVHGNAIPIANAYAYPNVRSVRFYMDGVSARQKSIVGHVEEKVEFGHPAEQIAQVARDESIDLIVMVTHGSGLFERLLGTSVAAQLIRNVDCPVLAIRDQHIPEHFLVALDGEYSEEILPVVVELAELFDAEITLTSVRRPEHVLNLSDLGEMAHLDRELAENIVSMHAGHAEQYLNRLVDDLSPLTRVSIKFETETGNPASAIPSIAARRGCDVIAMVTHGRVGFEFLRHGSVTEAVMRRTDQAVLVLHKD